MSMISAKGQEHVKIEAKIPEDIDIAFKKYLWLLDMTLDEGIRQAILHYMEYLDKQPQVFYEGYIYIFRYLCFYLHMLLPFCTDHAHDASFTAFSNSKNLGSYSIIALST